MISIKIFTKPIFFIKSVFEELKKVTWISKKNLINLTIVVLAISAITGIILQFTDIALQYIINKYL